MENEKLKGSKNVCPNIALIQTSVIQNVQYELIELLAQKKSLFSYCSYLL